MYRDVPVCSLMDLQHVPESQEREFNLLILEEWSQFRIDWYTSQKSSIFLGALSSIFFEPREERGIDRYTVVKVGSMFFALLIFFLSFLLLGSRMRMRFWMPFLIGFNVSDRKRIECRPGTSSWYQYTLLIFLLLLF